MRYKIDIRVAQSSNNIKKYIAKHCYYFLCKYNATGITIIFFISILLVKRYCLCFILIYYGSVILEKSELKMQKAPKFLKMQGKPKPQEIKSKKVRLKNIVIRDSI